MDEIIVDSVPNALTVKRRLRAFLCHSSGDKPAVRGLYRSLRTFGIHPWLDEENLLPGQAWELEIPKAVRSSDIVIVCLSRGSVSKAGYVQKEIKFALDVADEQPEGAIFIIPLRLVLRNQNSLRNVLSCFSVLVWQEKHNLSSYQMTNSVL
jgi:hypothetical protein